MASRELPEDLLQVLVNVFEISNAFEEVLRTSSFMGSDQIWQSLNIILILKLNLGVIGGFGGCCAVLFYVAISILKAASIAARQHARQESLIRRRGF